MLARFVGVITAACSAVLMVAARLLTGPAEMTITSGALSAPTALAVRAIGARDTIIGVGILVARPGPGMAAMCGLRAVVDLGDAALFGSQLPSTAARLKIGGFAAGWAIVSAVAALRAVDRRH